MRHAGLDGDDLAGARLDLLTPDLQADRSLDYLEALGLVRVDMCGGNGRAGLQSSLDYDVLAPGIA